MILYDVSMIPAYLFIVSGWRVRLEKLLTVSYVPKNSMNRINDPTISSSGSLITIAYKFDWKICLSPNLSSLSHLRQLLIISFIQFLKDSMPGKSRTIGKAISISERMPQTPPPSRPTYPITPRLNHPPLPEHEATSRVPPLCLPRAFGTGKEWIVLQCVIWHAHSNLCAAPERWVTGQLECKTTNLSGFSFPLWCFFFFRKVSSACSLLFFFRWLIPQDLFLIRYIWQLTYFAAPPLLRNASKYNRHVQAGRKNHGSARRIPLELGFP